MKATAFLENKLVPRNSIKISSLFFH